MIDFIHPCPGTKLTSKFGPRKHPVTGKVNSFHKGLDFAKAGNIPILATADGVVKQYIGDKTTYGIVVFIQHTINGKRYDSTYAHLKSRLVKDGEKVKQGQIIGYMGNTGGSTGQHLHFEIHDGPWKSGQPNAVDPLLYIDKKKEAEESEEDKLMKEQISKLELRLLALEEELKKEKQLREKQECKWAQQAIDKAIKAKAMLGDTEGKWNPNKPITRAEVAKVLENLKLT